MFHSCSSDAHSSSLIVAWSPLADPRNVLDEEQLAEMVLAPEGWQVDKSTIPTGYMMHIMSVGNGVKATLCGREGLHIVNSLHRDVSKCKRLCDTGLCGHLNPWGDVALCKFAYCLCFGPMVYYRKNLKRNILICVVLILIFSQVSARMFYCNRREGQLQQWPCLIL